MNERDFDMAMIEAEGFVLRLMDDFERAWKGKRYVEEYDGEGEIEAVAGVDNDLLGSPDEVDMAEDDVED
jgi:carbamoylphosphate synthase small subunit